jgi:hypothetical protein
MRLIRADLLEVFINQGVITAPKEMRKHGYLSAEQLLSAIHAGRFDAPDIVMPQSPPLDLLHEMEFAMLTSLYPEARDFASDPAFVRAMASVYGAVRRAFRPEVQIAAKAEEPKSKYYFSAARLDTAGSVSVLYVFGLPVYRRVDDVCNLLGWFTYRRKQ